MKATMVVLVVGFALAYGAAKKLVKEDVAPPQLVVEVEEIAEPIGGWAEWYGEEVW